MWVLSIFAAAAVLPSTSGMMDDWHYPDEEPEEHALAQLHLPTFEVVWDPPRERYELKCPDGSNSTDPGTFPTALRCGPVTWAINAIPVRPNFKPNVTIVLETSFKRWGLLGFVFAGGAKEGGAPILLRKSVGLLTGMVQPTVNLSDAELDAIDASNDDIPMAAALKTTTDGEPDYPSVAAQLPPQRDTAAISHAADVVKFAVAYSGRVKCASNANLSETVTSGGIAELQDLHAAPPDPQKVVFDPSNHISFWPRVYGNTKTGLLGGHLPIANVGAFTAGKGGFELVAFGPVPPNEPGGLPAPVTPPSPAPPRAPPPSPSPAWTCHHWTPAEEAAIDNCKNAACQQAVCAKGGSRWTGGQNSRFPGCGTCYCCQNAPPARPGADLPRLPNINYDPGVFVMLREVQGTGQTKPNGNGTRFFYAKNSSTFELGPEGANTFYNALLAVHTKATGRLSTASAMKVALPASDRRQADMANTALLSTSNNYVGDQPNYGFGATYWSYGREDNGSLPLDMLSVDNALLGWGMCSDALRHIEFYYDNYVKSDGTIWYGVAPWTHAGDSISDYGRLIDIYVRAVRLCSPTAEWQAKNFKAVRNMANLLLRLQAAAPKNPSPPLPPGGKRPPCMFGPETPNAYIAGNSKCSKDEFPTLAAAKVACASCDDCGGVTQQYGTYQLRAGKVLVPGSNSHPDNSWLIINDAKCRAGGAVAPGTAGLIIGPPEHDWSGTTTKFFYNNNAWTVAGLQRLGTFLSEGATPRNASYGAALLKAGAELQAAVLASVAICQLTDPATGKVDFLPPYAEVNSTKYPSMHASGEASYANFRFFSEPLLAATMPQEVAQAWLSLHNQNGGRVGGASRWSSHLDDMPTAGWGFGALANNQTQDFLVLLYGHMATYQSRGTFHSTEQLSFRGSGRYRGFTSISDPAPGENDTANASTGNVGERRGPEAVVTPSVVPTKVETGPMHSRHLRYYGKENDVSFCIVSNILVALMTRWQLVFEEPISAGPAQIWLGRGSPKRWFVAPSTGFNVTNAPTAAGPVGYQVVVAAGSASYVVVTTGTASATGTRWTLRWPGTVHAPKCVAGCGIHAVDAEAGLVTVFANAPRFTVDASWA